MQNIRSVKTNPEIIVTNELLRRRYKFEINVRDLPGKPDIVFRLKKIAVFIDSDFWHGHKNRMVIPKTNVEYWESKINGNRRRDKDVNKILKKMGWTVIRLWVYDIKNNFQRSINRIITKLKLK
jgi:DNA mismatch endonuclease, patch repair protein